MEYHSDSFCGIIDYEPIAIEDDYGVDAKGRNVNGDKC